MTPPTDEARATPPEDDFSDWFGTDEARAGEPRTEAGRRILDNPVVFEGSREWMRQRIIAIERESAAAPALDVDRLAELVKRHGLSQMLNESGPAFLPLRDLLSDALRLSESAPPVAPLGEE